MDVSKERAQAQPFRIADAKRRIRHVFVRDLELEANIGVYHREQGRSQPVLINVDLTVEEGDVPLEDKPKTFDLSQSSSSSIHIQE